MLTWACSLQTLTNDLTTLKKPRQPCRVKEEPLGVCCVTRNIRTTKTILYKPQLMHFLTLARIHKSSYHKLSISFIIYCREDLGHTRKVWIKNTSWVTILVKGIIRRRGCNVCLFSFAHTTRHHHHHIWCCKLIITLFIFYFYSSHAYHIYYHTTHTNF